MNVYDFDKTIYNGDSTAHFYLYCLRKYPKTLLCVPYQAFWAIPFGLKILEKTKFKEKFYKFLNFLPDTDKAVAKFWQSHRKNLKSWYTAQKKDSDIIISASPYFLLKPFLTQIGIENLMASDVNKNTGKYTGINCHGKEKVRRFYDKYPNGKIEEFYSDSLSDSPLANIAEKAFMVKGSKIVPWPNNKQ